MTNVSCSLLTSVCHQCLYHNKASQKENDLITISTIYSLISIPNCKNWQALARITASLTPLSVNWLWLHQEVLQLDRSKTFLLTHIGPSSVHKVPERGRIYKMWQLVLARFFLGDNSSVFTGRFTHGRVAKRNCPFPSNYTFTLTKDLPTSVTP